MARLATCLMMVLGWTTVAGARDAGAAVPGAVTAITWGQSRADVDREVALLAAAGARYVRANVNWAALEPDRKGAIDTGALATYDYAIDRARAAGLEVIMPVSDGVPYWASGDPRKHVDSNGQRRWDRFHPPASFADYGDIVRFVAGHYSKRGVHVYEIWNEPNLHYFWSSGPDPVQYTAMLKAGYAGAKAADPDATVLMGGLSKNDFAFLEGIYRAGGGPFFDAVAVHPYTYGVDPAVSWNGVNAGEDPARLSKNSFPAIKEIRRSMEANGDGAKKVWITEFGYSTTTHDGGVSEATQAAFLTKAYAYVEQFPWVEAMLWYSARNSPWYGDADTYEGRFGLYTADWRAKPSYAAFQAYAAKAAPAPADTPTDDTPAIPPPAPPADAAPAIRLASPVAGQRFSTSLQLTAEASDDAGVERVEFRFDGRLVATEQHAPYSITWKPPRKTRDGEHLVTATAYDTAGQATSVDVAVVRTSGSKLAGAASLRPSVAARSSVRGRTVVVRGRIPARLARPGTARVELQVRDGSARRWRTLRRARVSVKGSRYRLALRAAPGRWRIRVVVAADPAGDWASRYRSFTV